LNSVAYKFSWVGVPKTGCNCYVQTNSPNGDFGVDAAISVIAHELTETVTDPTGGGWCYSGAQTSCFASGSVENADQCAWFFPKPFGAVNYNIVVGTRRYLVQANWKLSTKTCTIS